MLRHAMLTLAFGPAWFVLVNLFWSEKTAFKDANLPAPPSQQAVAESTLGGPPVPADPPLVVVVAEEQPEPPLVVVAQERQEPPVVVVSQEQEQARPQSTEPPAPPPGQAYTSKDGKWDYHRVREEFVRILGRIREAPVIHDPFPHIEVPQLLSDSFYAALMEELPPISDYKPVPYAGTAPTYEVLTTESLNTSTPLRVPEECRQDDGSRRCFFKKRQLHEDGYTTGLVFKSGRKLERRYPLWARMYQLFHSINFTRTMVEKFTLEDGRGIPEWKRAKWNLTHGPLLNSAALRIEPSRYHVAPHVDIMEKLVTWQFFHPLDSSLADRGCGTTFYRPKSGLNMQVNDAQNPQWMDYDLFEPVGEQKLLPNRFFSFVPSNISWHGASIDPPQLEGASEHSRRTFLGFITAGESGFHGFRKPMSGVLD